MALGDPTVDPLLAQLYGLPIAAPGAPVAPGLPVAPGPEEFPVDLVPEQPGAWIPEHWQTDPVIAPSGPQLAPLPTDPFGPTPGPPQPFATPTLPAPVDDLTELPDALAGPAPSTPPLPPPVDSSLAGFPDADLGAGFAPAAPPFVAPSLPAPPPGDTGDFPLPPAGEEPPFFAAEGAVRDLAQAAEQVAADPFTALEDDRQLQGYLNDLALRDRPAFAELQARHEEARRRSIAARKIEAINRDYDQQVANLKARQEADAATRAKMDAILADAQRIADTKIDPTGGLSTGRKIAGIAAAIVGGLVQGRTGSARNAGLDALNEAISQGIAGQQADLANRREGINLRRNVLAAEIERHGDDFRAAEVIRLAALKHADDLLAIAQQDYDPRGTTALRIAAERAAITSQIAANAQAARVKAFDLELKIREQRLKEAETLAGIAKTRAETAKLRAEAPGKQLLSPDVLAAINPGLPRPPIALTREGYVDWLKTQKVGSEAIAAARANSPEERGRQFGVGDIVDDQGNTVEFRSEAVASELAKIKGKVETAAGLIDRIIALREKYGWSSNLAKSPEWRQVQADYTQLQLTKKDIDGLGVITGPDLELLEKSVGTGDPTEVRDPLPGLRAARRNIVDRLNSEIRAQAVPPKGRKVLRWEPINLVPPAAQATAADKTLKAVLGRPEDAGSPGFALSGDIAPADDPVIPIAQRLARAERKRPLEELPPAVRRELVGKARQLQQLDMWAAALLGSDPAARDNAAEAIGTVASSATADPAVRARARQIQIDHVTATIPGEPERVR